MYWQRCTAVSPRCGCCAPPSGGKGSSGLCRHSPVQINPDGNAMGGGGRSTSSEPVQLDLLQTPQFEPFLDDQFDPSSFASRSLSEGHTTAAAQTETLQHGVAQLDGALRQLVLRHQDDLVAQASRLAEAEAAVQRISLSVRSLQLVAGRVRGEVAEPFQQLAARTRQLKNLQATVELLRHVIHRLKLVQRLRQQMAAADGAGACVRRQRVFRPSVIA